MALFSTAELTSLKNQISEIVHDTSINVKIKYRQFVGQDYFNPEDQMYTDRMYNDWANVSAIKGVVTSNKIQEEGSIQVGDTKFVFMQSSVSAYTSGTTATISDVIVDYSEATSGTTHTIIKMGYDPLGIVRICYTRVK